MNLPEPTQTSFTQAEAVMVDLMKAYDNDIDTKKGSVVRQLVIRPYAYLYAKINQFLSNWINRSSIKYLSSTTDTSDSIADLVASNYFVTRKQGFYATGLVAIVCTSSQISVAQGARFSIDSIPFVTAKSYIATPDPAADTDTIGYRKMLTVSGEYMATIPVQATQPGIIQIPAGAQVQILSYIAGAQQASLLSPITGGKGTETNAQLMERCRQRCGSAIGTLQAIRTKMQEAPVQVISCGAIASSQASNFTSRYNNIAIPVGGKIDIPVKTANQLLIKTIQISSDSFTGSSNAYCEIDPDTDPDVSHAIRILSVQPKSAVTLGKYTVDYLDMDNPSSAAANMVARGTVKQKVRITLNRTATDIVVTAAYMPYLAQLQTFIDAPNGIYVGQVCSIKAAIPASLSLTCSLYSNQQLNQTFLQQLKEFIANIINSKQVGDYNLNMDQVAQQVEAKYTNIRLRLPYTLRISMPMSNGGLYTFHTSDGTVSLLYRRIAQCWAAQMYYFSITPSDIHFQVSL